MAASREIADALSGFMSTYIPEKRRRKDEDEELRRWNLLYEIQQQNAAINQQNADRQNEEWQRRKDEEDRINAAKAKFAEQLQAEGLMVTPETLDYAMKLEQIKALKESNKYGPELNQLEVDLKRQQIATSKAAETRALRPQQTRTNNPKMPGIGDLLWQASPGIALQYQDLSEQLRMLDDRFSESLRLRPDQFEDPNAYKAWEEAHNQITARRDQTFEEMRNIRGELTRAIGGYDAAEEQPKSEPETPLQQPEVWNPKPDFIKKLEESASTTKAPTLPTAPTQNSVIPMPVPAPTGPVATDPLSVKMRELAAQQQGFKTPEEMDAARRKQQEDLNNGLNRFFGAPMPVPPTRTY